jgi:hypothetical protein
MWVQGMVGAILVHGAKKDIVTLPEEHLVQAEPIDREGVMAQNLGCGEVRVVEADDLHVPHEWFGLRVDAQRVPKVLKRYPIDHVMARHVTEGQPGPAWRRIGAITRSYFAV